MKKLFSLLFLFCAFVLATSAQSDLPTFSTKESPVYFRVKFRTGGNYLQDNGSGQKMTVASTTSNSQLFAFIGTRDKFVMRSRNNNYVQFIDGATHFTTTNSESAATDLSLLDGNSLGFFEIAKATDHSKAMNQWGGTSNGANLGLWNKGDNNNTLSFIDPSDYVEYSITPINRFVAESLHTLWYKKPAYSNNVGNVWMEYSLPIGNGELGASLFGGVKTDEIQFNEKTLWTGSPNDMGHHGTYMNFGSVVVKNLGSVFSNTTSKAVRNYVRFLDIDKGVGGVNYTDAAQTSYTQRYIASAPDGVIAARYKAEGSNKLHLRFSLVPGERLNDGGTSYTADGYATFAGKLTTVYHNARFKVVPIGGTMKATNTGIVVEGAEEILLILCGGTSFDSNVATRTSGNASTLAAKIKSKVDAAAAKTWDALYEAHVKNFTSYTARTALTIHNATAAANLDTEGLIKYYNASDANKKTNYGLFLEQLYFHYGRYLAIASSRGMNVPNNLQGIWNNSATPPWNSDIHTNINIQMNYWPTEPTNLSDCHLPFLNYIIDNAKSANWQAAARRAGVNKGWTLFTETNIFGGMSTWGDNYFVANAWYTSHLWQHYRYTLDRAYLKRAFPAMWGVAEFWMARMIKDRGHAGNAAKNIPAFSPDGTWVCPDEYSAEQNDHPREDATAHAQQLVMENLQNCLAAVEVLGLADAGISQSDLERLKSYITQTDNGLRTEAYTNKWGTINGVKNGDLILREWKYAPYSVSNDQAHRHMSHLMCLYPFSQVKPGDGLFEAAVKSLALRGDVATGWSMGWKVNLWARAKDGDHAHIILRNALKHSTDYGTNQYAGGIYYNLFDSHSPFQIDGNFGVCAGVAEMLLQSHQDIVEILPALPSAWKSGKVRGLKAIGDFQVDIDWDNNKASKIVITNRQAQPLRIKATAFAPEQATINGSPAAFTTETLNGESIYVFTGMQAGQTLVIDYTAPTAIAQLSASPSTNKSTYDLTGRIATAKSKGIVLQKGKKLWN